MNKQKVAILGSGLTAKTIGLALIKLDLDIDLIDEKQGLFPAKTSNATISLSDNSLKVLQLMGIKKKNSNFWPIQKIILYDGFIKSSKPDAQFFNLNSRKNLNHLVKKQSLKKEIEKNLKKIKIIKNKIFKIEDNQFLKKIIFKNKKQKEYNLIIATDHSNLKLFSNEKKIKWDYSETAYTFLIHHQKIKNICSRQFFLRDGPLAFLPISSDTTSVVWSVKNNSRTEKIILDKKKRFKLLKTISSEFYKITSISKQLEYFPLTFNFLRKVKLFRTLFVGDITHKIHPIAGQGWNMSVRDIDDLSKILKMKLSKGYDIGSEEVLNEFEKKTKVRNLLFAVSIDLIRRAFRAQSSSAVGLRKKTFSIVSQPILMKKIIDIADRGLRI